jgi:predicted TIM-barrel fold metal-dependent hydrolase
MFIDIHAHAFLKPFHLPNEKADFCTPEQLIERYDRIGVEKGVLLPLVSPESSVSQTNEDVLKMVEKYPERFIPFCNIDPRSLHNSPEAPFGELLRYYKDKGVKGLGEITANLPFRDERVQNLLLHLEQADIPFIFHIGPSIGQTYGLYDDVGLGQLDYSLAKYPKLKFLGHSQAFWAEMGPLEAVEDRAGYPSYALKAEGVVPKLMRKHSNLYGDLSAASGHNALARDPDYAVQFLDEFQDRLFFGLDICDFETPTPLVDLLMELRDSGKISEEVFGKVARDNAMRVLQLD